MLNRDIPLQTCNAESLGKNLLQFNISIARRSVTANFCLQTFPAPISVFAINYLKYWNYCKYRGAAAYLRAYRDISRCTCYLFVRLCSKCPPATHFGNFWSQDLDLSNYALQAYMRSKYQMFCASLEPGKAKEVDLQDFSFVAKSGGVCASRQGAALQSLFICLPRQQNLICNQFNRKVSPRKLSLFRSAITFWNWNSFVQLPAFNLKT